MNKEELAGLRSNLSEGKRALLEKMLKGKSASPHRSGSISRRINRSTYPLSLAQRTLWFAEQASGRSALYVIPTALRFSGAPAVAALEQALNFVLGRHEVLRSSFTEAEGEAVQRVSDRVCLEILQIDFSDTAEMGDEAWRAIQDAARRPMSLANAPLVTVSLIRTSELQHLLLLRMHHIIADEWSMGLFLGEVVEMYGLILDGAEAFRDEPPIQYADFAAWERQWAESPECLSHLEYWKAHLSSLPTPFELPYDYARSRFAGLDGDSELVAVTRSVTRRLQAACEESGATMFMSLVAALALLIRRYSGQSDITIGSPTAGRLRKELGGMMGCFVNMLPLRVNVAPGSTFSGLLASVRTTALEAYSHQDLPFERLVEELRPARQAGRSPFFDVVFAFQNTPAPRSEMPRVKLESAYVHNGMAKFDLTLSLAEVDDGISGYIEYSSALFEATTIRRMAGHYLRLIESATLNPHMDLSRLSILSESERLNLIEAAHPKAEGGSNHCIDELFRARAAAGADRVAVVYDGDSVTYGSLDRRSSQLASYLKRRGASTESRVCVLVDRSIEFVASILAILKAGSCYVPVDPAYPAARIKLMIQDSGSVAIITEKGLTVRILECEVPVILVDDANSLDGESPLPGAPGSDPSRAAYAIYTSGSTGLPKGVVASNHNVVRLLDATSELFDFSTDDVWTLFHSFAFDFSVWEVWGALLRGARLVVVPYMTSRSPEGFHRLLSDERVTVLNQTPSAFSQLIQADSDAGWEPLALRAVIFGGEALDLQALKPWVQRHSLTQTRLANMYGITETTVHVTCKFITSDDLYPERRRTDTSPIGSAIPDLGSCVLDENLELVPAGVTGELFVAGDGVTRGYLNQPGLTAQRFLPDAFTVRPGRRLYRSGDLARLRGARGLTYLGRADQQIKIRGFRIEPGEIESCLVMHPSIRDARVVPTQEGIGARRLTAYVVPVNSGEVEFNEIRTHLRERLPDYMVPASFVAVSSFPVTGHGKLDVAALSESSSPASVADKMQLPSTVAEQVLVDVWRRVLCRDRIGIADNFFDLGGDSILSIKVISLARQAGLWIELPDIFRHQTVSQLAGAARTIDSKETSRPAGPFSLISAQDKALLPSGISDAYPLTMLQAGMLFHSLKDPEAAIYHNVSALKLSGRIDPSKFQRAANRLVDRHEVLRTSFNLGDFSQPLQLVHSECALRVQIIDVQSESPEAQERWIANFVAAEKRKKFDWSEPPLLRITIHRIAPYLFQMTMSEHHAILDGWSVASLLLELFRSYVKLAGNATETADIALEEPADCSFA